jgi:hypothetical protein
MAVVQVASCCASCGRLYQVLCCSGQTPAWQPTPQQQQQQSQQAQPQSRQQQLQQQQQQKQQRAVHKDHAAYK